MEETVIALVGIIMAAIVVPISSVCILKANPSNGTTTK